VRSAIERDLGLYGAAAGLLTALPVLCMALFAPGGSGRGWVPGTAVPSADQIQLLARTPRLQLEQNLSGDRGRRSVLGSMVWPRRAQEVAGRPGRALEGHRPGRFPLLPAGDPQVP
jgi:hypothetical protein